LEFKEAMSEPTSKVTEERQKNKKLKEKLKKNAAYKVVQSTLIDDFNKNKIPVHDKNFKNLNELLFYGSGFRSG
jgi:hypothetical protein